jgi:Bacterial protein of unknown function (DUF885)
MQRIPTAMLACLIALFAVRAGETAEPTVAPATAAAPAWIAQSDAFTRRLLDVQFAHAPESGSRQGLAQYDTRISVPTLADELAERHELETALAAIEREAPHVADRNVREDIAILRKAFDLQFRRQDYRLAHEVPFSNASEIVFQGLRGLLDDQVPPGRHPAALVRLRKYSGLAPRSRPLTEILKERAREQMSKPGVIYPAKSEIETELGRDSNYVAGIAALFEKYHLAGWEPAYTRLKSELAGYDAWVRAAVLPKARTDFRLPPEEYALALEGYGVDVPPAQIAGEAHAAFREYQSQMAALAERIAKERGLPSSDYRLVIAGLKKNQITGEAILPFYRNRLREIERIIVAQNLVSLPNRPAIIRLASPAETVQQPAPHMVPPPFLHNTGQRGQFVLPLNIPSATGGAADQYDDFTYDAVSWTLTAHEARPGHELQFDSMVEHGVSLARALFAFNSTNAEGWGLYCEYLMQPYEPMDGQLITLELRLLRAARAFLDPELQSGKITPAEAYRVLEQDVVLSHAFAEEEVERFTYRSPGQAISYFYGFTRLLALRKEAEGALGARFSQHEFHDFILSQGLLPPDLMRRAVLEEFLPSQS